MALGEKNNRNHVSLIRLYIIIYITMLLFGIVEMVKSVTLPAIKLEFGINYATTGGLISFAWFGYVFLCFVVTLFLQRFGIKKSIAGGYLLLIVGCILILFASSFSSVMVALFMISAAFGFFEVGNNALAMKIFTKKTALLMSLMHFFYGLGAVLGPYFGAYVLQQTGGSMANAGNWRLIYVLLSIPVLIFTVNVFLTRFNGNSKTSQETRASKISSPASPSDIQSKTTENNLDTLSHNLTFSVVLKMPVVWVFIIMLGLMEVVEFGAANWGPFYLKDMYGLSPEQQGAIFVSLFYVLFTISRLFGGFASERLGYYRALLICIIMTILIYLIGFLLGLGGIWVLCFTGLFIAQFWILILSIAEKKFKSEAAIITSVIITMSGLINGIFQIMIGLTNEYIGQAWGYRSCALYATVILILALVFRKALTPATSR